MIIVTLFNNWYNYYVILLSLLNEVNKSIKNMLQVTYKKCTNKYKEQLQKLKRKYSATQQESRFLPLCTSCSLYLIKLHAHEPNLVHS